MNLSKTLFFVALITTLNVSLVLGHVLKVPHGVYPHDPEIISSAIVGSNVHHGVYNPDDLYPHDRKIISSAIVGSKVPHGVYNHDPPHDPEIISSAIVGSKVPHGVFNPDDPPHGVYLHDREIISSAVGSKVPHGIFPPHDPAIISSAILDEDDPDKPINCLVVEDAGDLVLEKTEIPIRDPNIGPRKTRRKPSKRQSRPKCNVSYHN